MMGAERGALGVKTTSIFSPYALLPTLIRIIVGGVLIYSGASKALGPTAEFAAALAAYKILPAVVITPLAQSWPWLELIVGTYILFGFYTRIFSAAAAGMFVVFLTVLLSAMVRGIDPGSCGCFGMGVNLTIHQTAGLDALLLALTALLFILAKHDLPASTDRWIHS